MAKDTYLDQLAAIPLLSALSRKELQRIAKASDEVTVEAGHELVRQRNGRKIATAGPGSAIGELSLLDKGPRTATITADTDCKVLVLGAREFAAVLDEVPGLAHKLLAGLAARVRELDTKVYG